MTISTLSTGTVTILTPDEIRVYAAGLEIATGPQGIQGPQGLQGEQGDQGIQGIQGIQGVKGDKGDKGDTGNQGIQGIQGIQGVKGDKGDKGDQGDQGIQGIQGIQGEQGLKGDQGDQGIQGDKGDKGDKGDQGDQGIQGIQGDQGIQGIQGEQGLKGDQGDQGLKGDQGDQGVKGDQGDQGIQGIQGEQGIQGIQGIQGETGATGVQGDRPGFLYEFSTSTSSGNPGSGVLKFNNATLASVTKIILSTTTADSLGISEILDVIDNSTSTNKARVSIRSNANGDASFFSFLVTSVTTHAGYYELNGTYVDGAAFSNTEFIVFDFYQTGDIGATGATGPAGGDLTAGPIRSVSGTSSINSQTGTGDTFVMSAGTPTITSGMVVDDITINSGTGTGFGNFVFGAGSGLSLLTTGDQNTAIGSRVMESTTTGRNNVGIGSDVLRYNVSGESNIGIGAIALNNNSSGNFNVAVGASAFQFNTTGSANVGVGGQAGVGNLTGGANTFLGVGAGNYTGSVSDQVFVGTSAGSTNGAGAATLGTIVGGSGYTDGTYTGVELGAVGFDFWWNGVNVDITVASGSVTTVTINNGGSGFSVGQSLFIDTNYFSYPAGLLAGTGFSVPIATITNVSRNTAIGRSALALNSGGANNTVLGYRAGRSSSGSANVFLGYEAGTNESTNDNLYISNTSTSTPLIYGKFDNTGSTGGRVKINGNLEIKTKTPASATDTGVVGEIAWDADYIYICTATNTWKRTAISTW